MKKKPAGVRYKVYSVVLRNEYHCYCVRLMDESVLFYNICKPADFPVSEIDFYNLPALFYETPHVSVYNRKTGWKHVADLYIEGPENWMKTKFFERNSDGPGRFYLTERGPFSRVEVKDPSILHGLPALTFAELPDIEERLFSYFFRGKELYDYEYNELTYDKNRINDGPLAFKQKERIAFNDEGFWPIINPPPYYHLLPTDEEKLAFGKKSFNKDKGWDLSFLSYEERTAYRKLW